jgi:NAD(P)-dependent dehydrogenase (short-subunit alcohol dehydrogenase family)
MSRPNKVCLVTGANSGIGKATALGLAELGATVVMLCRNRERGETVREEIISRSGNSRIDVMWADLSEQSSIREFVTAFKSKYDRLHVLSHNAGVVLMNRQTSSDGIEKILAINYLSRFLLTTLLLDVLKQSSPARITNVSGPPIALRTARINFDDIQFEEHFNWLQANTQVLLAGVLFSFELASRLKGTGVTSNAFFPGVVRSNITQNLPWYMSFFPNMMQPFFTEKCKTSVYLASSPEVENISGKFFVNKKVVEIMSKYADETSRAKLWTISETLTQTQEFRQEATHG